MPTYAVDHRQTFATVLLMASGPKLRFGTTEQDISATGERKWEVNAAATWLAEPGRRVESDLLRVTILGPSDPAAGLVPGTPIEFDHLRVGTTAAEATEGGKVRGGRNWHSAAGVHAVNGHRPAEGK